MAMQSLVQSFSNLNISSCSNSSCVQTAARMTPYCQFTSKMLSSVEANLFVYGTKYNLKATGYYSDISICLMYGKTSDNKSRTHWGIICQQQKGWVLNGKSRKCLLFHHMGDGVELAVGCMKCLRKRVLNVYGLISTRKLKCYDYGRSSVAVYRFLGEKSLKRNIGYKYNSKYTSGNAYYEWRTTNCCRLVFDLLFYLKLDYSLAVKFTVNTTGLQRWDEIFATLRKDYPEFVKCILVFWLDIKNTPELAKVEKLMDGQYKLNKALEKLVCVIL